MEELKLTWLSGLQTCKLRSFGKNYLADAYSPSLQLLAVPNGPEVHLYHLSSTTGADQSVTPTGCTLVCDLHSTHTTTSTHRCCNHRTVPTCSSSSSSYRRSEVGGGGGGGSGKDAPNNALHVAWGVASGGAQSLLAVAWAHALAVYQIRPSSVDFLATKLMEVALNRKPCGLSWHPCASSPLLAVYDITEIMLAELSREGKDMDSTRGRLQYHVSHFSPSLPGALECVSWGQRGKTLLVCMEGTLRAYRWPAQERLEHVELKKLAYTDSKLHKRVRAAAAAGPGLFVATTDTDLAMRSTSSRCGYMRQHQQQAKGPPSAADAALHLIHVHDSEPGDVDTVSLGPVPMPDLLAVRGPAADSRGCLAAVGSHTADTITIHRLSPSPCTGRAIEPLFRIKTAPHTRPKGIAFIGSRLLVLTGARENAVPHSAANWAEFKMSLEMYTLPPSAFHVSRVSSPCTTSGAVCSANDTVRFAFTTASTLNNSSSSSINTKGKSSVLHQTHTTHATTSTNTSSSATTLRKSSLLSTPPRQAWSETNAITPRSTSSSAADPQAFSPSRSPMTPSVSCNHDASSIMRNEPWKGLCDHSAEYLHSGLHVHGGVCAPTRGEACAHGDMHRQVGAGVHDSGLEKCIRGGSGAGVSSQSDATWRTGVGKQVAWSSRDTTYNTHSASTSHNTHYERAPDSRDSPRTHGEVGARAHGAHGLTHGHGGMHTQGTTHAYSGVSHTHSFGSTSGNSTDSIRQPTETARVDAFNPAAERVKEPCPPMLGKCKGTPSRVHHIHADTRCSPRSTTPAATAKSMPCRHGVGIAGDGQPEMERKSVRQGTGECRMAVHGPSAKLEAEVHHMSPRPLSHTVGHSRTHTPPRHDDGHSRARETELSNDLFGQSGDSALRVSSAMSMTWPAASVASTIASPERGTSVMGVGECERHTPVHVCRDASVGFSPMSQPPLSCRSSACARGAVDRMGTAACTAWASGAGCGQQQQQQEQHHLYGEHQEQQQHYVHSVRSQSSLSGRLSSCSVTGVDVGALRGHSEEYANLSGRHDDEQHYQHDHHNRYQHQQQQQRHVHYEEASHQLHPHHSAHVATHTAHGSTRHLIGEGGEPQQSLAQPPPSHQEFRGHEHHEWMEAHAQHVQYPDHDEHQCHQYSGHDHHHQQQPQTPLPFHSPASIKAHVSAPSTPLYIKYPPPPPLPPTPGRVGQAQVSHSTSASAAGDLSPAPSSPIRVVPPPPSSPPRTSTLDPHTTVALRTHVCPVPASTYAGTDTLTHAHSNDVHTRAVTAHAHSDVMANTSGSDAVLNRILCVVEGLSSSVKHVEEMVQENNQRIEVLEQAVFRSSSRPCSRISHVSGL